MSLRLGTDQGVRVLQPMLLSKVERDILEFGRCIDKIGLAGIVMDLYESAIQESSRKQYGTGQRAYLRFVAGITTPGYLLPFHQRQLQRTELMLAFFMACLLLKPSITRATTILAYETHVKWN